MAYKPVICPNPLHPDVGHLFPLLASTNVYGILFLFRGLPDDGRSAMEDNSSSDRPYSSLGLCNEG